MTSEEIKQAMREFTPIEYDDIVYERISAYIFRCEKNKHTGKYRFVYQVELADYCGHSVTIAPADRIKIAERKENERNKDEQN